jgi:pyrroline-5-carboxylate reductase
MALAKIAVIGAGVIGETFIRALLENGVSSKDIYISEKRQERFDEIVDKYGVDGLVNPKTVDVVFLAVKPQDLMETIKSWEKSDFVGKLVVTYAAGIKIGKIEEALGAGVRVIRVMPNTPLTVGRGMSALSMGSQATSEDQEWLLKFLGSAGSVVVVPEDLQDAVTATSGSGPAYFFAFTEAIEAAAKRLGLGEAEAKVLAKETLIGAALMADKSGKELKTLRENVTSPNGTTAAALQSFSDSGLDEIVYNAMKAARDRSIELSS